MKRRVHRVIATLWPTLGFIAVALSGYVSLATTCAEERFALDAKRTLVFGVNQSDHYVHVHSARCDTIQLSANANVQIIPLWSESGSDADAGQARPKDRYPCSKGFSGHFRVERPTTATYSQVILVARNDLSTCDDDHPDLDIYIDSDD